MVNVVAGPTFEMGHFGRIYSKFGWVVSVNKILMIILVKIDLICITEKRQVKSHKISEYCLMSDYYIVTF
jgi:hypothetical protein